MMLPFPLQAPLCGLANLTKQAVHRAGRPQSNSAFEQLKIDRSRRLVLRFLAVTGVDDDPLTFLGTNPRAGAAYHGRNVAFHPRRLPAGAHTRCFA